MTLHEWFTRYPPGYWAMGYFDAWCGRPARIRGDVVWQLHLRYLVGYQAAIDERNDYRHECEKRGAVR